MLSCSLALSSLFGCAETRPQTRNNKLSDYDINKMVHYATSARILQSGYREIYGESPFELESYSAYDTDNDGNVDRIEVSELNSLKYILKLDKSGKVFYFGMFFPHLDRNCILGDYNLEGSPIEMGCKLKGEKLKKAQAFADAVVNNSKYIKK